MDRTVTLEDLLAADSIAEFRHLWSRFEPDPIWLLIIVVPVAILFFRYISHSNIDRKSPERGTYYLGNTRLGQNPKIAREEPLRTRLRHDPQYERDEDA